MNEEALDNPELENTEPEVESDDFATMSDDEFSNLEFGAGSENDRDVYSDDGSGTSVDNLEETLDEEADSQEEEDETTEETEENDVLEGGDQKSEEVDSADDDLDEDDEIDSRLKELFSPFKANGKEMQIDNVGDARTLMQKGADYEKKMSALKPHRKILRMLQNNDLLDEDKLNRLIDLDKKDPNAITHLVKESGINPLTIDTEDPSSYKPSSHNVTDEEVQLADTFDEIRETSSFSKTLDIINNDLDAHSKSVLLKNPNDIKAINAQVANGTYEHVMNIVDRERTLGRLDGMADLEAYIYVGQKLQETSDSGNANRVTQDSNDVKATAAKEKEDKRKARMRSAAIPKKSISKKQSSKDYDPLAMSDEEFEKLDAKGIFD